MLFNLLKLHKSFLVFLGEPMMLYTDALNVLFKYVNLHLVAMYPIINKAIKLCWLLVLNLDQFFWSMISLFL